MKFAGADGRKRFSTIVAELGRELDVGAAAGVDLNARVGELEARNTSTNDGCRASCVDWYGNARPLFIRGRVFALLGYELVEGKLDQGRMIEVRRISYAPQPISQRTP